MGKKQQLFKPVFGKTLLSWFQLLWFLRASCVLIGILFDEFFAGLLPVSADSKAIRVIVCILLDLHTGSCLNLAGGKCEEYCQSERKCPQNSSLDNTCLVWEVVEANPDGGEGHADDKEKGQHAVGSQDGLPSRQPLLLEGTICNIAIYMAYLQ